MAEAKKFPFQNHVTELSGQTAMDVILVELISNDKTAEAKKFPLENHVTESSDQMAKEIILPEVISYSDSDEKTGPSDSNKMAELKQLTLEDDEALRRGAELIISNSDSYKMEEEAKKIPFENHVTELLGQMEALPHGVKEVFFLGELIKNSCDALRSIRFESLVDKTKLDPQPELFIDIVPDKRNGSLSIIDSGMGMTEDDLRSLSSIIKPLQEKYKRSIRRLEKMTNVDLSGFLSPNSRVGLGFYSVFMFAHTVVITTKQNGHDQYVWESKASEGSFSVARDDDTSCGDRLDRGTKVTLFLKAEHLEYLDQRRLEVLVAKHTFDICPYPISISVENGNAAKRPRLADANDKVKEIDLLKEEFEGLRNLFAEVLGDLVESVVVSDRIYDLPSNVSLDRKTMEINPRSPIMKNLKKAVELNPEVFEFLSVIRFQFYTHLNNIRLYDIKYGTNHMANYKSFRLKTDIKNMKQWTQLRKTLFKGRE